MTTMLYIAIAAAIGASLIGLYAVFVKHKGPAALQRLESAAAHRVVMDALATWEAAVAAEVADAKAAQAKAEQSAAALTGFKVSQAPAAGA